MINDNYVAYNGCIYAKFTGIGASWWRRLELYLPSATGTYNEPIVDTFNKWCDRLDAGEMKPGFADGVRYQLVDGKPVPMKKEKA